MLAERRVWPYHHPYVLRTIYVRLNRSILTYSTLLCSQTAGPKKVAQTTEDDDFDLWDHNRGLGKSTYGIVIPILFTSLIESEY